MIELIGFLFLLAANLFLALYYLARLKMYKDGEIGEKAYEQTMGWTWALFIINLAFMIIIISEVV